MKKYIKSLSIHINDKYIIKIQNPIVSNNIINNYLYEIIKINNKYSLRIVEHDMEIMYDSYMNEYFASININNLIGFISINMNNTEYIFKTTDILHAKNKGIRCSDGKKTMSIQILNSIIGESVFNKENTSNIIINELCCMQEIIFRHFNTIEKSDKLWMFNYEQYLQLYQYNLNK
jgi:hypothetical protein